MRALAAKLYQRVSHFTLAFILAVSTVSGVLPFISSSTASALTTVNSQAELVAAIADDAEDVIELGSSFSITSQVNIDRTVILNGNGFTLSASYTATGGGNDSVLAIVAGSPVVNNLVIEGTAGVNLQGIQVWNAAATLNTVTVRNNNKAGIHVNGSTVTVDDVTTINNSRGKATLGIAHFGGIVVTSGTVTITGLSTHTSENNPIRRDGGSVVDTHSQYSTTNIIVFTRYSLKAAPLAPAITAPAAAAVVHGDTVTVEWTAPSFTSTRNAADSYIVSIVGGVSQTVTGLIAVVNGLTSGTYTVTIQSVAASGLVGATATRTFTINEVPTVVIDGPAASSVVSTKNNGDALTVTGTFTDNDSTDGYVSLELYDATDTLVGGSGSTVTNGAFSIDITGLGAIADGDYTVKYYAQDSDGAVTPTEARAFSIDNTDPVVTVSAPSFVGGPAGAATIGGSIDDAVSYKVFAGDLVTPVVDTTDPFAAYVWDTSSLATGTYTVRVEAVDAAGNVGFAETTVTVDNTAPTVAITSSGEQNTATPTISGTIGADATALDLYIDGVLQTTNITWTPGATVWSFSGATFSAGSYAIEVRARDSFGNQSTQVAALIITVPAPEVVPQTFFTPASEDVLGEQDDVTTIDTDTDVAAATDDQTENLQNGGFGLAWYWWLAILAALGAAWWAIAAWRRNREEA